MSKAQGGDWSLGGHALAMDYLTTKLSGADGQRIIYQLLKGVAYIHNKCVMHRVLTPKNVYIDDHLVNITHISESELSLTTNSNCLAP